MIICGIADFGEENEEQTPRTISNNSLADHGLVFMFSSLADKYCQPVAVYGCKGPTAGLILAKLILQVLCKLEESGTKVHGIVCDGASTNRNMWRHFGVSGKYNNVVNKFKNPMVDNRFVYIFSDAPHLIKCVRNRIYGKNLKVQGNEIKWDYYSTLFNADSKIINELRVCPKLTNLHLDSGSMLKMRVKLATRLFSNSVANSLKFYKNRALNGLEDSDGTIEFTKRFNDLFDVLNRKFPAEGIRCASNDFQIIQKNIEFLNS